MTRKLWLSLFLLAPLVAHAQSVQQSGNVTPGHAMCWATTGVAYDCGTPGGSSIVGSFTANDLVAVNGSGSLIDSGINPTSTSSWPGLQNFNGGATAPTRPVGDNTTYLATTAFITAMASAVQTFTPPSPAWGTNYGNYFGVSVNVNGVPNAALLGGGSGATPAAFGSAIQISASDIGTFIDTAGAFTILDAGGGHAHSVGLFSAAIQTGNVSQSWALNTICGNTPVTANFSDNTGFDGSCHGAEFDVNVIHKAGGVQPIGLARGVLIAGGSTVNPTLGSMALEISQFGNGGANLAWTWGIFIDAQPSTAAIMIGSRSIANTANTGSQNISFGSVNSDGVNLTGQIYTDANGDITLNPASVGSGGGGGNLFLDGNSNVVFSTSSFTNTSLIPFVAKAGVVLNGTGSGAVSILPQAAAGTFNFNLPITAGTSGYVLTSAGGAASAMTWTQISGIYAPLASPTFTGTVTMPDSSTWTSGGLSALTVGAITASGLLRSTFGVPTIASGACGTGTNGTVAGTNQSGIVTIGATSTTTCTVSFSATLSNAPNSCVIFPGNATAAAQGTTLARVGTPSTASWIITGSALASTVYSYICL